MFIVLMSNINLSSCNYRGCINYKGKNRDKFSYPIFTKEELCEDCELKQYPERYKGCCFCGKAIKYSLMCWDAKKDSECGHLIFSIIKTVVV